MSEPKAETRPSRRARMLARALARRCRGRTLIVGQPFGALLDRLREQGHDAGGAPLELLDPCGGDPGPERFDTVVLVQALEYLHEPQLRAGLERAHALLDDRGTLLVCVPNERHAGVDDVAQRFDRRRLKQLLKTIDQPKVYTDQPFGWLLMALSRDPRLDRLTEERHRVIARLCRGATLELGCAAGHLSRRIADRGLDVLGIDKNADKIAKAARLFPELDFRQGDILEMSTQRQFGTVVLAEVLEHVDEQAGDAMLARAWEQVEPGGRLVVSVPNEDCVPHRNHVREFTARGLAAMLRRFGRPRAVVEQPYRWLLMYVDRKD